MAFDIAAARKAGYSESEILEHLAGTTKFDIKGARKAGYNDAELLEHMSAIQIPVAKPASTAGQIPGAAPAAPASPATEAAAAPADPTLMQKIVGAGEAGLTVLTGATGGTLGLLGGTAGGTAGAVGTGQYGTQEGVRNVEEAAFQGMQGLTYQPRTEAGKKYAGVVGEVMQQAVPVIPLTAELQAIGRGASVAARAGADYGAAGVQRLRTAAPGIAERVDRTLRRNPVPATPAAAPEFTSQQAARLEQIEAQTRGGASRRVVAQDGTPLELPGSAPRTLTAAQQAELAELQAAREAAAVIDTPPAAPTPGTQASGGSAGTDMVAQRTALAEGLPVPIKLTRGQSERSFEQQRFEREISKDPQAGAKMRDRFAQQNEDIMKNIDAWVDQIGAEAPNLRAVGASVDKALVQEAARGKAEIRVAYKNAEKAGELEAPVALKNLVEHLNESAPDVATAPLLKVARDRALQLGIAQEAADGTLTVIPTTLKNAERMRQAVGRATDYEATNIRQSAIIKGLIDAETDGMGGNLYRTARRTRENYAKKFEDRAVVASLLNNKKGMADRKIALEDVFEHSMLKGSLDDVRAMRKVLQTSGADGVQAWRELQGQTLNWIKDEATKNVATDIRGNAIVSADKLNKAIRSIDNDGKMDFIFGKQGAQQLRDINDLAKVVFTSPPGAVNSSNTASVLLAALTEAGAAGAATGLPVPILSALRHISVQVKNRAIQKRIEQALANRPAGDRSRPSAPPERTLH